MRENQGPFSECNRTLPLFCSVDGEASACEGRKPRTQGQKHTINFFVSLSESILSTSTVSSFTNSSNMDTDSATTPGNNTEDALVDSSPIGAQAAPDDDDVQIVDDNSESKNDVGVD